MKDYERLKKNGIPMPEMIEADIVKEGEEDEKYYYEFNCYSFGWVALRLWYKNGWKEFKQFRESTVNRS